MELFTLSKKEKEFENLLWDAGVPLSRSEILAKAVRDAGFIVGSEPWAMAIID